MSLKKIAALLISTALVLPGVASAWGDRGHRIIGEEAMRALPDYVPAFLRTPQAATDVGEYSREPDRWKKAGFVHDSERNAAHFINLLDDGTMISGTPLTQMPRSRMDYEAAVVAKGGKPWNAGYLPYAIIDLYQQVTKDMAYWRVLSLLEARETDPAKKAWYRTDRVRREQLLMRDLGELSHYVGDSSQPLHVTQHHDGWGEHANPNGYTQEEIHWPFEGTFPAAQGFTGERIRGHLGTYTPCTDPIETCVARRLEHSFTFVIPLYELEKAGGFKGDDARGITFVTDRMAQGATDLRNYILDAWRDSKTMPVGYPGNTYDDYVGNKVADPWRTLYGE